MMKNSGFLTNKNAIGARGWTFFILAMVLVVAVLGTIILLKGGGTIEFVNSITQQTVEGIKSFAEWTGGNSNQFNTHGETFNNFPSTSDEASGVVVIMNRNATLYNVTVDPSSGCNWVAIRNSSDGTTLAQGALVNNGTVNTTSLNLPLTEGVSYDAICNFTTGGSRTISQVTGASFPYANDSMNFTSAVFYNPTRGTTGAVILEIVGLTVNFTGTSDVQLISPADNFETINTTNVFNCSLDTGGTADIVNISIFTNQSGTFELANTTIFSGTNQFESMLENFTFNSNGNYLWSCQACDTDGDCRLAPLNRTIIITVFDEVALGVPTDILETDDQVINLNITTIPSILNVQSELNYNGTMFPATTTCVGSDCSIISQIDAPLTEDEIDSKNFFFEINVFDGSSNFEFDSSMNQQNVTSIFVDECNATLTDTALNFTTYDEVNLSQIAPFGFEATFQSWLGGGSVKKNSTSGNLTSSTINVTEFQLCISNSSETFKLDSQIKYGFADDNITYVSRDYFTQAKEITNSTEEINLFLLENTESTSFILKVQDENLLPVQQALIEVHRFYPGENLFRIVQIARTDDNGKSVGFFETETVDYKFVIKKDGITLLETEQQKIIPETSPFTLTFNTGDNLGAPWQGSIPLTNSNTTLSWNISSGIVTYSYIDNSTTFEQGRLLVTRDSLSNSTANVIVCNDTSTLSSATITCNVGNTTTAFYTASGYITRSGSEALVEQINFQINDFASATGLLGLFFGWFLIVIATFIFKFNEIAGMWATAVTIFLVNLFGLINFGAVFVTAIIGVVIILTWLIEK